MKPFEIMRVVDAPHDKSTDVERKTFDEGRDSMQQGWTGTFEQFAAYLSR